MLALSKSGQVIHYSKSWNALMDYVDEETGKDVIWKPVRDGKVAMEIEPPYKIYNVDNSIKSTITSRRKLKCWHCNETTKPNESKDRCTICKFEYQKFKSREEYLTYIIDSLLVNPTKYTEDYNLTVKAIEAVAVSIRNNPNNYPVTVSLYRFMQSKELV